MQYQDGDIVKVRNLTLVIDGEVAVIQRNPDDRGTLAVAKYGAAGVAVVRHFLRYYISYRKISIAKLITEISDWTSNQKAYEYLEIRVDDERIRRFVTVTNQKRDPFFYSTPEIGLFELLANFLMFGTVNKWLSQDVYRSLKADVSGPEAIVPSLEGDRQGKAKEFAKIYEGTYHARGEFEGAEQFIEFYMFPMPDSSVSRVHIRAMLPSQSSADDEYERLPSEQVEEARNEAEKGYGWHIGTERGPSFGVVSYGPMNKSFSLQITAAAEPEPEPILKSGKIRKGVWNKDQRARDLVVRLVDSVDTFDAEPVRALRPSARQGIGPQLFTHPVTEKIRSQTGKEQYKKLYYMSLITTIS